MKTKTLGHEQLAARILETRAVRAQHERLNREDFAILDEILAHGAPFKPERNRWAGQYNHADDAG